MRSSSSDKTNWRDRLSSSLSNMLSCNTPPHSQRDTGCMRISQPTMHESSRENYLVQQCHQLSIECYLLFRRLVGVDGRVGELGRSRAEEIACMQPCARDAGHQQKSTNIHAAPTENKRVWTRASVRRETQTNFGNRHTERQHASPCRF